MKRAFFASIVLVACGPSTPPPNGVGADTRDRPTASANASSSAGVADFRAHPPKPGPPVTFVAPKIQETKLSNGIRVLVVEQPGLPIVGVNVSSNVGSDTAAPGVGSFAAGVWMRGTKTRSAIEVTDQLESLGANMETFADFDSIGVGAKCLSTNLTATLAIVADVAEHPAFANDEVERERSRRLTQIAEQHDRPRTILANAVSELLYPAGHPYASPLIGTTDVVKKTSRADLEAFYKARFAPDRVTITIAGDIDLARATSELEKAFGSWSAKPGAPPPAKVDATASSKGPHIVLIDRPKATQSSVSVAGVGAPRKSDDYDALMVMNTILGGQFSSRLNMNLREAHAYTYGVRSGFAFRRGAGPFDAGGEIIREKTGPAITEMLNEIARMRSEPVSDDDLADAKSTLIDQLPARFETAGATAGSIAALGVYGLPLDEYATRPARWSKITREDVMRVSKTYLAPERLIIVVVGDASVVAPQLDALHLGEVEKRAAQ
jgi:zinc protease